MFNLSHVSLVKEKYSVKWLTLYTERSQTFKFHKDRLQNHCCSSFISMTPNSMVVVNVLLPICLTICSGMPFLRIFEDVFAL